MCLKETAMNNIYDLIIIGSGLGGLVTGNILSKKGYKVGILEKNPFPGGCLHSFEKNGVIFDTGIHYFGGFDKGQVLNRLYKYLGVLESLNIRKMDPEGFDRFIIGSEEYAYSMGYDKFRSRLISYFPDEKIAIDKYIQKIREISRTFALYNLEPTELDLRKFYDKFNFSNTWEYICSITTNQKLRQLLAGHNFLYAGKQESSFLFVHALITNHYLEGAYRFVDGSKQIADRLVENFIKNAGEIVFNKKAIKFKFNEKKIISLITADGEEFFAKQFISAIHPYYTLEMIEPGQIRTTYKNRIQSLNNTISTFTLNVVLKDGKVPYMNSNYYYYPNGNVWGINYYDSKKFPQNFGLYPVADSVDEKYTRAFSIFTFMEYDEVAQWENTKSENRGIEYDIFKETKAQKVIHLVEEAFPGMTQHIKSYSVSTPLTLKEYSGTYRGAIYGIERDYRRPLESLLFPRTKIPNLYLTGQNLNMHGFMGVSIGALLTCAEFIDLNELLKEINHV
jgi:all-trans-retinol 13,14-reductase